MIKLKTKIEQSAKSKSPEIGDVYLNQKGEYLVIYQVTTEKASAMKFTSCGQFISTSSSYYIHYWERRAYVGKVKKMPLFEMEIDWINNEEK